MSLIYIFAEWEFFSFTSLPPPPYPSSRKGYEKEHGIAMQIALKMKAYFLTITLFILPLKRPVWLQINSKMDFNTSFFGIWVSYVLKKNFVHPRYAGL
jgi:hypothetical protein